MYDIPHTVYEYTSYLSYEQWCRTSEYLTPVGRFLGQKSRSNAYFPGKPRIWTLSKIGIVRIVAKLITFSEPFYFLLSVGYS